MPLLLDDVGAKNPLKQTHVNQKGISDWDDSKNGGYHYDTNTIDPQDVNGDGIPNLYDRRYVRRENDSDGDGLPNNVDANPYNDSKHGNHDISDDP